MYLTLVTIGLSFLEQFLAGMKNQAPANVVTAVENAIAAISVHKADLVTQASLEANRG